MKYTAILLIIIWASQCLSEQCNVSVDDPWPTPFILVPQNSSIRVNCRANRTSSLFWSIDLASDYPSEVRYQFSSGRARLNANGVYESTPSDSRSSEGSTILINDTTKNNGTVIRCTHSGEVTTTTLTSTLFVLEPSILTIDAVDTESLQLVNVTWSSLTLLVDPEPNQTYTLTVKSRSFRKWTLQLNEQYYLFTAPEGAPQSEVYSFSATATYVGANYTGDGCSAHSPVISRTLPSLPDIKGLNSTLTYSLIKEAGKVTLNASFESAIRCENYPVNYTLEVNSSSETASRTSTIEQGQYIVIDNLLEDREYSFTVLAANAVGVVSSTKRQFCKFLLDTS